MPGGSYVTTDFRGGVWSNTSQGRTTDERYKTGLNVGTNSVATEQGPWQRRPGFRLISITRKGRKAQLRPFRFSREQPYQMEFTQLRARFIVGLDLVRDVTETGTVSDISAATPAIVTLLADTTWSNGDTVIFDVNTDSVIEQPTTHALFGRQFEIGNVSGNTFALYDPVTGAAIDGSTIDFVPRTNFDGVRRILEVVTPYTVDDLPYIRVVNTTDEVIVLCRPPNSVGYPPYRLVESGTDQFTFAEATFIDGPFLDQPFDTIKNFTNDLVLSGVSGSVTVTADSTAGINDAAGFQQTDIGRQIWLQTGPPSWDSGTTYDKEFKVLGSDGNIYKSLIASNLANDPATDDGTKWEITSDTVVCTYGVITAVSTTLVCTITILGDNAKSVSPTRHWRLGVYSDTTGYPSCGCFHENRLVLGGAVKNRFDGSRNFRTLTFSPTEVDGTVSDDNAIAGVLANKDAEDIAWCVSGDDGMIVGTLAGEWKVSASNLDDPITPTSIQARNVTTNGSAPIDPPYVYGAPYSIQSNLRKLTSHNRNYKGKYETTNLSAKAEGLMLPSLVDVAWVQEPLLSFFVLRSDGKLLSCLHRKAVEQEEFTGWFYHEHALGRFIESMSHGPDFSGVSDSLYVTTWDEDDDNPRWIETMMPVYVTTQPVWRSWHTDASSPGYYVRRMITANGEPFNGLRIYLSWYMNGETVHPYIGGLDLGDFVVSNGYIDVPFTSTFTFAFLTSLNDGTDYDEWGVHLVWSGDTIVEDAQYVINTISVLDDDAGALVTGGPTYVDLNMDDTGEALRFYSNAGDGNDRNIQVFDATTGEFKRSIDTRSAIFNGDPGTKDLETGTSFGDIIDLVKPDRNVQSGGFFGLVGYTDYTNSRVSLFDRTTLTENWCSDFTDPPDLNLPVQALCLRWSVRDKIGQEPNPDYIPPWSKLMTYALDAKVFGRDFKCYQSLVANNLGHDPVSDATDTYWENILIPENIVNNFVIMAQQGGGGGDNQAQSINLTDVEDGGAFGLPLGEILYQETTVGWPIRTFHAGFEFPGETYWYEVAWNNSVPNDATAIKLRLWSALEGGTLSVVDLRTFVPDVDFNAAFTSGARNVHIMIDKSDRTIIMLTTVYPSGDTYVLKLNWLTAETIWNVVAPFQVAETFMPTKNFPPLTRKRWHYMTNGQLVYELNTTTGVFTQITGFTTGFSSYGGKILYDEVGPSLLFRAEFNDIGGEEYLGPWAIANEPSWSTQVNRSWLGLDYTQNADHDELSGDLYFIPNNVGVSFTSDGQLLRPDFGVDGGQRAGPAFGKKRRNHWYAMSVDNGFNIKVGVNFTSMHPVKLMSAGGTVLTAPTLFSGIMSDTINDDYSWDGRIAWRVTRQYPCTITSIGGYIDTQDK